MAWRGLLAQARRDLLSLTAQLRGDVPPPFRSRGLAATPPSAMRPSAAPPSVLAGRAVRVDDVVRETADAVTLVLSDPAGAPFDFMPGQFFTVCVTVDGEPLRRAYSASSPATTRDRLCLTVKRVPGGRVSTYLTTRVAAGDTLSLLGPSGSFTVEPDALAQRRVVLVAGGSGITPIMSLVRTLLLLEPATRLHLVYGNRAPADVIFAAALDALAAENADRFVVRHVYGLLGRDVLAAELDRVDGGGADADYFVCGPEPMMVEARAALAARGVDGKRIHEERFTQPHLRARPSAAPADAPQPITIVRRGRRTEVLAAPGATVLEAGLAAGLDLPFSCAMGGCAACKVRLVAGDVDHEEPSCLGADERAAGEILACVSRARGPVTVEVPE